MRHMIQEKEEEEGIKGSDLPMYTCTIIGKEFTYDTILNLPCSKQNLCNIKHTLDNFAPRIKNSNEMAQLHGFSLGSQGSHGFSLGGWHYLEWVPKGEFTQYV